jgi:hypothetical protein
MNNKNSYIEYIHTDSSIKKIGDLVGNPSNMISVCYAWNIFDFLNYTDEKDETNLQKIINKYESRDEKEVYINIILNYQNKDYYEQHIDEFNQLPIKRATLLIIPKDKVNVEVYSTLSNQIEGLQVNAFLVKQYKDLLLDSNFSSIFKNLKNEQLGGMQTHYPNCTVWLWCRSLFNDPNILITDKELQGVIFNLTPFIINLNTNTNAQVGNFSLELNNLICYYDENKGWQLKNIRETKSNGYISKYSLDLIENGEFKRNQFFFNTIISENDIIFIRFETLKNEIGLNDIGFINKIPYLKNRLKNQNRLIIDKEDIPGNIYDMIGLVDLISASVEPNNITLNIQGRDLTKLLIEDGCYFYPIEFIPGGMFSNEMEEDYLERIDGKLINLTQGAIKTLSYTLKFIINNLAHIKICSEDLFNSYGERVSKTYRLDIKSRKEKNKQQTELYNIIFEIKKLINSSRQDDNLEDNSEENDITFERVKNFLVEGKKGNYLTYDGKDFIWDNFSYLEGEKTINVKANQIPISLDNYLYPVEYQRIKSVKSSASGIPSVINLPHVTLYMTKLFNLAYGAFKVNLNRLKAGDYDDNIDSEKDFEVLEYGIYQDVQRKQTTYIQQRDKKGKLISSKSSSTWNSMKVLTAISYPKLKDYLKRQFNFYTIKWFNTNWYPVLSSETWFCKDKYGLVKSGGEIDWDKTENLLTTVESLLKEIQGQTTIGTEAGYKITGLGNLYKKHYITLRDEIERRLRPVYGDNWKTQKAVTYDYEYKNIRLKKDYSDLTNKEKDILRLIWDYLNKEQNFKEFVETYEQKPLKGIWKIIKLVVDDEVDEELNELGTKTGSNIGNRRICDSSIGNENGTLMSAIQKICQEPFVHFSADTYGDQFYFTIHQPSYTEKAYKNLVDICSSLVIKEADILQEKLQFNTDNIYSWYKLRLQNSITDLGEGAASSYLKAVHFKEYSDIWGERPLEVVSNYLEFHPLIGDKADPNISYMVRQHLYDLKYLVDINSYMPFTRKGIITIVGDRRIKKGLIIKYEPTGEVFMVDSVSQSYQNSNSGINRTTTLEVSRGMVESCLDLYFHIIDTPIEENKFYDKTYSYYDWVKVLYEKWKVNREIFYYFLLKKQFTDAIKPKINDFNYKKQAEESIQTLINPKLY